MSISDVFVYLTLIGLPFPISRYIGHWKATNTDGSDAVVNYIEYLHRDAGLWRCFIT